MLCLPAGAAESWLRLSQTLYRDAPFSDTAADNRSDSQGLEGTAGLWSRSDPGRRRTLAMYYDYIEYDFETDLAGNIDVHNLQFPLHLSHEGDSGSMTFYVAPGVAVSSNTLRELDFDIKDFIVDAGLVWRTDIAAGHNIVVGAVIDRRFGRTALYPLLGTEFEPTDSLRVSLLLPEPVVVYQPAKAFWLGLGVRPAGNRWRIYDRRRNQHWRLREKSWSARIEAAMALRPALWAVAAVSYEWDRELDLLPRNRDRETFALDATWFVSLGIGIGAMPPRLHAERFNGPDSIRQRELADPD